MKSLILKIKGTILIQFMFVSIVFSQQAFSPQAYKPIQLTSTEKAILTSLVKKQEKSFDSAENMIITTINGYQYHTDAVSGKYHQIRISFYYALALLNTGDTVLRERAFAVIRRVLSLQDTLHTSPTCGIWPYYMEEPLQTKKSPPDFNMADFNAVTLIEIWLGHYKIIPASIQIPLKHAILLAAYSIKKRGVSMGYTNIALMGTYVTYMAGHIFGDTLLMNYSENRLKTFYDYTLSKKGFTEYNSPNYSITAMEELNRMQLHFIDIKDKKMVDSMYHLCWQIVARHYHAPSGQWSGPHSRSYNSLISKSFYSFLAEASDGKIFQVDSTLYNYATFGRYKHTMPIDVMNYFIQPVFPRTETDVFEPDTPKISGTSFLTEKYALSSVNHASLWNQRRPLIAYWGTIAKPKYLQVRMLHDLYDFSSASLSIAQQGNKVLAAMNFNLDMGDKHITIDKIKNGIFTAKDMRLRFEFGNTQFDKNTELPLHTTDAFTIETDDLTFNICLFEADMDNHIGYWEKGKDHDNAWVDFVFYKGAESQFNLKTMQKVIAAFSLMINIKGEEPIFTKPTFWYDGKNLIANWEKLCLTVNTDVQPIRNHGGWF